MIELSIVIPAYQEAQAIAAGKLARVTDWLAAQPYATELLVVDDGSTDDTAQLAQPFATRVITIPHQGKAALRDRLVINRRACLFDMMAETFAKPRRGLDGFYELWVNWRA